MSSIRSYKDLIIWQKGIEIVKEVYRLTKAFPEEEKFGLISQMIRSAVSIPSNIAEGWGRDSTRNYSQFIKIARGSLLELETQLILSKELHYIDKVSFDSIQSIIIEENKMMNAFIKKLDE